MRVCTACMKTTKEKECCGTLTLNKKQLKTHLEVCKKASEWRTVKTIERLLKDM